MIEFLSQPWPWYIAGPIIGLMVPALLLLTGKSFGVSSSLRHVCAAVAPGSNPYLKYDWKTEGGWNLLFVAGIVLGGFIAGAWLSNPDPIAISEATRADLAVYGIRDFTGMAPSELFSWQALGTLPGFVIMIVGGFLIGFGARYAGGCTSGHAIMGLATFQKASLYATIAFFIGGIIVTFLIYPILFN
ncbi:MAG: YeeE/YedE thiosulfate transporter family protein [Rhodothermales bacterium]|nr:YeeE/YedE thiosulfate transporter family protein [Rhodothermales bacterium]